MSLLSVNSPFISPVSKPWWLSSVQDTLPILLMENKDLIHSMLLAKLDTGDLKLKSFKWKSPPLLGRAGTETQKLCHQR